MLSRRGWRPPLALAESGLGGSVPDGELRELDRLSTRLDLTAGRLVIRQATPGRECLVVIEGALVVERDEELVAVLGPGEVAGELALLTDRRRSADVTADTDTSVYAMNRREFATVIDRCPVLARHVMTTALRRSRAA